MGFHIGSLFVAWYGVIIASAMAVAFILGSWLCKKMGYKEAVPYQLLFILVPLGIACARLYYVIFAEEAFHSFIDVIAIWRGGIAIYGGILGGALGLLIYTRIKKCGFFTLTDILVLVLVLAQAIGRWGNFMNILGGRPEAYGIGVKYSVPPFTVMVHGSPHLSFWLFESILNFAAFGFLMWFFLKKQKTLGQTTSLYLMIYGAIRGVLEPIRGADALFIGAKDLIFNRISFLLSIVVIALGVVLWYACKNDKISQNNRNLLEKVEEPKPEDEIAKIINSKKQ